MTGTRSVVCALSDATEHLAVAGVDEPRLNSELLLAELLGCRRSELHLRRRDVLSESVDRRFGAWLARRVGREPLQHILGTQEFYGITLKVDGRALIPRPETEGLIDAALSLALPDAAQVADLGTGSGCIPIALALARPDVRLAALDRSVEALDLARENVKTHGLERRIELARADLGSPPGAWLGRMHLVLSNPPYVTEAEWAGLEPEVRDHDPRLALVSGPTGLEAYAALAPVAFGLLRPAGQLLLELGQGQADAVSGIVADAGFVRVEVRPDLNRIPRVLLATRD